MFDTSSQSKIKLRGQRRSKIVKIYAYLDFNLTDSARKKLKNYSLKLGRLRSFCMISKNIYFSFHPE